MTKHNPNLSATPHKRLTLILIKYEYNMQQSESYFNDAWTSPDIPLPYSLKSIIGLHVTVILITYLHSMVLNAYCAVGQPLAAI